MENRIQCEICRKKEWKLIETYEYEKKQIKGKNINFFKKILNYIKFIKRTFITSQPRFSIVTTNARNKYQISRIEVLFNVWFKSFKQITIKSKYCNNCGFALYFPRPSKEDIEAKYMFLINNSFDYKIDYLKNKNFQITSLDLLRSRNIFKKCELHFNKNKLDVLDYGGGRGTNLIDFLKNGSKCYLLDFDNNNLEGILNIGNDINKLESNQKFDLIICSHVLEHISDLSDTVKKLKMHLKENGIIYAEVPLEIKAGISLEYEPVTHINFFTNNSLANLFLKNGFEILDSRDEIVPYTSSFIHASWVMVRKTEKNSFPLLKSDIREYLYPYRLRLLNLYSKIVIKNFFNKIYFLNKFL